MTAADTLLLEMRALRQAMERQQQQLEELRRENAELRAQLAASAPTSGRRTPPHSGPFQHQPYAIRRPTPEPPAHRLDDTALLAQDEQIAADLAADPPLTPRPATVATGATPMSPDYDVRGRSREQGEPTPEKPAMKKPARSASEGAHRDA